MCIHMHDCTLLYEIRYLYIIISIIRWYILDTWHNYMRVFTSRHTLSGLWDDDILFCRGCSQQLEQPGSRPGCRGPRVPRQPLCQSRPFWCRHDEKCGRAFHKWEIHPKSLVYNGKSWKIPFKWMIEGYPHFRKPPCDSCDLISRSITNWNGHVCGVKMVLFQNG